MQISMLTASAQSPGTLDTSFCDDGIANYNVPGNNGASQIIEQPDGKILILGGDDYGSFITRINNDSTIDYSFGTNGVIYDSTNSFYKINLENNGNILVQKIIGNSQVGLTRYLNTGHVDTTFAATSYSINSIQFYGNYMLLMPNNKYVTVLAEVNFGTQNATTTLRGLNYDGTVDSTFGNMGIKLLPVAWLEDAKVLTSGKILLFLNGGFNTSYYLLERFYQNGAIDSAYGSNGIVTEPFSGELFTLATDASENSFVTINIVGGHRIVKHNSSGIKDATFGTAGEVNLGINRNLFSINIQPNGKILIGGNLFINANLTYSSIIRLLPNGSFDSQFGNAGEVNLATGMPIEVMQDNLVSANGKIYCLLNCYSVSFTDYYFVLARLNGDAVTGIDNNLEFADDFVIYPNPAKEKLSISNVNFEPNEIVVIKIMDISGKEVLNETIKLLDDNIEVSNLDNGIYFLTIQTKNKLYSSKITVQH